VLVVYIGFKSESPEGFRVMCVTVVSLNNEPTPLNLLTASSGVIHELMERISLKASRYLSKTELGYIMP
jgi:hypothetical protein